VDAQVSTVRLDSMFDAVDRAGPMPAAAVAVLHHGRVVYQRAAGYADMERGVRATAQTRFDWASVAKQFTGFALAQLGERGAVAPEDDVRRFLPELDLSGATVTVDHLLRHTSGLEDCDGLLTLAGWAPGDAVYDRDVVDILLRQQHLRWVPGEQEGYGNGGYALLAEIVSRISGMSFTAYADSAIFRRLGMKSTSFPGSPHALVPDRALPYVKGADGRFESSRVDTYVGAGGLVATVGDMALWARHLLHPGLDAQATARIKEPGRLVSGEAIPYGWGIAIGSYRGRVTLGHGGSGVATETYMVVFPELDFAVVAASASPGIVNPVGVANLAAELFLGDALEPVGPPPPGPRMLFLTDSMISTPPPESAGVVVPAVTLAEFGGTYRLEDGTLLVVRPASGRLEYARNGGLPYIPLFPVRTGTFVMMPLRDAYTFERDANGEVTRLVVERRLPDMEPRRNVAERVQVDRFDTVSAAPYVGWYYSDELRATYEVALGEDGLELRNARHGAMPLIPLGTGEEFGVAARLVRGVTFSRATGGAATGMELRALSWDARSSFRRIAGPGGGV
jgi:CubicO group peptidase (beta-lactamase class C family)